MAPPRQLSEQGNLKEDAAQTLSNLSQGAFPPPPHTLAHQQMHYIPANISDPGPSSHPRGPPNLGQLSAVAAAGAAQGPPHEDMDEGPNDNEEIRRVVKVVTNAPTALAGTPNVKNGNAPRARARSAAMGSDEWTRQRKDNHVRAFPIRTLVSNSLLEHRRKRLSADAVAISTKALTNLAASFQTAPVKKQKAPFFRELCNTYIT
jgi:hypothetical protein